MKWIIAGSRTFDDFDRLCRVMDGFRHGPFPVTEVVCGGAKGADILGERWAVGRSVPVRHFIPQWKTHGKRAGFLRNQEMADYADKLVVFWDGESHGTKDMIRRAAGKSMGVFMEWF